MDFRELNSRLQKMEIYIPSSTLRNWASEELIPCPKPYIKGRGGGKRRFINWPENAVEEAAAVYYLRHYDVAWARPTKKNILAAKDFVARFYSILEEAIQTEDVNRSIQKFNALMTPDTMSDGRRGLFFGSYMIDPLIKTWIATIEKIRHNKPITEQFRVVFNWRLDVMSDGNVKMIYKGVTFEPSDSNIVSRNYGISSEEIGYVEYKKSYDKELPIDRENITSLATYDEFIDEGKRIYYSEGHLHFPNGGLLSCRFECGQTNDGQILCKCWFTEKVHYDEANWFTLSDKAVYILGFSQDLKIHVIAAHFSKQIEKELAIIFSAKELTVEYSNRGVPAELRFYLANFEFKQSPLRWICDGRNVTTIHIEKYSEIIDHIKASKGIDITAVMSTNFLSSEIHDVRRIESVAADICHLFSLANGHKVQWICWDALSGDGQLVKSYHWKPWITPYAAFPAIPDNDASGGRPDIWTFIDQTFDIFRQQNKEGIWKLREAIDHYIDAVLDIGLTELRALKLVTLIEYLVWRFADHHNQEYFIDSSKFYMKREELQKKVKNSLRCLFTSDDLINKTQSIGTATYQMSVKVRELNRISFSKKIEQLLDHYQVKIDKKERQKFKDIRDSLVHRARFLDIGEIIDGRENSDSKLAQYFKVIDFCSCIMLSILEYHGNYMGYIWDSQNVHSHTLPYTIRTMPY